MNFASGSRLIIIIPMMLVFMVICLISEDILTKLVLFYVSYIIISWRIARDSLDPRIFFLGFFLIYSTFYPIKLLIVGHSLLPINYHYVAESLNVSYFSFLIYVILFEIFLKNNQDLNFYNRISIQKTPKYEDVLRYISYLLLVFISIKIFSSGASTKRDVQSTIGIFASLGNFSALMLLVLLYLNMIRNITVRFVNLITFTGFSFLLFYMLLTGERDVFFRLIFSLLIIHFDYKKTFTQKKLIAIFVCVVIIVPISQSLKAILIDSSTFSFNGLSSALIFSNEFISSSRNLYALIYFGVEESYEFLLNDILRAIIPSFFISDLNISSTVSWYHNVYRPSKNFAGLSGWGFSSVGMGYVIDGYKGVFIISTFISSSIIYFYNRRYKSTFYFVFYLMLLMTAIYTIRADLANFISQSYKVGGFFIFTILLMRIIHQRIKKI